MRIETSDGPAIMHKGRPLMDRPKTYKLIKIISHSIGSNYNPGTMTIFRAKDGSLRYEIYRNGSFAPYYGRIEFISNLP